MTDSHPCPASVVQSLQHAAEQVSGFISRKLLLQCILDITAHERRNFVAFLLPLMQGRFMYCHDATLMAVTQRFCCNWRVFYIVDTYLLLLTNQGMQLF